MTPLSESSHLPTVLLPQGQVIPMTGDLTIESNVSEAALAYRTEPQLNGNLRVDPEILLPSPGLDVNIAYFYNSDSNYDGPFGYGRTISTNLRIKSYQVNGGFRYFLDLLRGDGSIDTYNDGGTHGYFRESPNLINTLKLDSATNQWKETTPDGITTAYPVASPYDPLPQITSVSYMEDAVGNRHTFLYNSGRLRTLQDAVGRLVTFNYDGTNHLQSIQDWADRLTTFSYVSIAGKTALATVIGPSGCQTGYGYEVAGVSPTYPRLNRITDPNGYSTTYAYDSQGRVKSRTIMGQGTSTYEYIAPTYTDTSGGMYAGNDVNGTVYATQFYLGPKTVITDPLGAKTTYLLDVQRNIIGTIDPVGVRTTMARQGTGQVFRTQDPYGSIFTTIYQNPGIPVGTIDPLGRQTIIQRDQFYNPTTMIYADGTITTMVWGYTGSSFDTTGAKKRLQVEVDALGHRTSYSYNGRGQIREVWDALGYRTTYAYDNLGNRTSVMNPLGQIVTYDYDLAGNVTLVKDPLNRQSFFSYDPQNRRLTSTDPLGHTTAFAYDNIGNLTTEIDPMGHRTDQEYNVFGLPKSVKNPLGYITTYQYDVVGQMTTMIDAVGAISTTIYDLAGRVKAQVDPLGRRTTTLYDAAGRPNITIDPLSFQTQENYNLAGQVESVIDELGYVTKTIYDNQGRLYATQDALGRLTTLIYDLAGRVTNTINALGYENATTYDALNRPILVTDPLGRSQQTSYDPAGRVKAVTDALGNQTKMNYDAAGQLRSVQNARGFFATSIYDGAGRTWQTIDPLGYITTFNYDEANRPISTLDARGNLTSTIYDALGQVIATQDPMGYLSSTTYDPVGQAIEYIDADNRRTTNIYDLAGQVKEEVNALNFRTSFSYDPKGQLKSVRDANGRYTTMSYDARGQLLSQQDALGRVTSYDNDAVGNVISRTDARGIVTNVSYDLLNRPVTVLYSTGRRATFSYDAADEQTQMADQTGLTTYIYDNLGRLQSVASPQTKRPLFYFYDEVGNRTGLVDPDNGVTAYSYDANDRLARLENPAGEITSYSYDEQGREKQRLSANGMVLDLAYDPNGREVFRQLSSSAGVLLRQDPTYGRPGQMLAISESGTSIGGSTKLVTFGYDRTYQLTLEQRNGYSVAFVYDGVGNRLSQLENGTLTTYSYDSANQLRQETSGANVVNSSFDANGNLALQNASGALTTYVWDEENRLIGVANATGIISTYLYNQGGERRLAITPSHGIRFVWDGVNLLQERDVVSGQTLHQYTDFPGTWGGLTSVSEGSGSTSDATGRFNVSPFNASRFNDAQADSAVSSHYFAADVQGNIRLLTDDSGNLTDSYTLSAFGELVVSTGVTNNPFLFGGEFGYFTDDLTLIYVRSRYYDALVGRWLSFDPMGLDGGDINMFRYVWNLATIMLDPDGLQGWNRREPGGFPNPGNKDRCHPRVLERVSKNPKDLARVCKICLDQILEAADKMRDEYSTYHPTKDWGGHPFLIKEFFGKNVVGKYTVERGHYTELINMQNSLRNVVTTYRDYCRSGCKVGQPIPKYVHSLAGRRIPVPVRPVLRLTSKEAFRLWLGNEPIIQRELMKGGVYSPSPAGIPEPNSTAPIVGPVTGGAPAAAPGRASPRMVPSFAF